MTVSKNGGHIYVASHGTERVVIQAWTMRAALRVADREFRNLLGKTYHGEPDAIRYVVNDADIKQERKR